MERVAMPKPSLPVCCFWLTGTREHSAGAAVQCLDEGASHALSLDPISQRTTAGAYHWRNPSRVEFFTRPEEAGSGDDLSTISLQEV